MHAGEEELQRKIAALTEENERLLHLYHSQAPKNVQPEVREKSEAEANYEHLFSETRLCSMSSEWDSYYTNAIRIT
jgi:hypothetical protein